jgi:hypothetical protein
MDDFIALVSRDYPKLSFQKADIFCWCPQKREIQYDSSASSQDGRWAVLHELSHALLKHATYSYDFELLSLEVAAWQKAKEIALIYDQHIDEDHIQNCLDTYREWLHQRSTCPVCENHCLQSLPTQYNCFNCHSTWRVTASRFCRPYRQLETKHKRSPALSGQTIFT